MGTTEKGILPDAGDMELLHENAVLRAGRLDSRYRPPVQHRSYEGDWESKVTPLLGATVIGCVVWLVTTALG